MSKEKYLSHSCKDHTLFGSAISKCLGYTPNCVYSGECDLGGDCFADEISYRLAAIKKIQDCMSDVSPMVALGLKSAIKSLNSEIKLERESSLQTSKAKP